MNNKINRSHLLVIVAVFCIIISGCLGGGAMSDLPDCETLYGAAGYWDNCQGTEFLPNGDKYVGEYVADLFHGQGAYTGSNGGQYVGEHKDGLPNGYGTMTSSNGDQWTGNFKDGLRHGQGTATLSNGDQYTGEWKEGKFVG